MTNSIKRKRREVLARLMVDFPKAFRPKSQEDDTRPLKLHIYRDIIHAKPEYDRDEVMRALGLYLQKGRYLRAILSCDKRIDLYGNEVEAVDPASRQQAVNMLRVKQTERRRA